MTKAEEKAVQRYPRAGKEYKSEFGTFYFDAPNAAHREGFIIGYEQAEKDINKELMDKMAEIREKQEKAMLSDMNYDIHFEPSVGFDIGSAVVYHNDKIVDELTWKDMQLICRLIFSES